jgi:hypothetical protein
VVTVNVPDIVGFDSISIVRLRVSVPRLASVTVTTKLARPSPVGVPLIRPNSVRAPPAATSRIIQYLELPENEERNGGRGEPAEVERC